MPIGARVRGAAKSLAAWADRHQPALAAVGYTIAFVLLFGGTALAVWHSGLANAAAAACGPICWAIPGFAYGAAALCGVVAVGAVKLYAVVALAVQRAFQLLWLPEAERVPGKPMLVYSIVGIAAVLIIMGFAPSHSGAVAEFFIAWWWGGSAVLDFFWPTPPGGGHDRSPLALFGRRRAIRRAGP